MKLDWSEIKEKIINSIEKVFANGSPQYSNLDHALDLLKKVVTHKLNAGILDGLAKPFLPALQEAYLAKIGDIGPLIIIADKLEAFLKRIAMISKGLTFSQANNMTLLPLLKLLELNIDLKNQSGNGYPYFSEANLDTFKGKDEYLEYLCHGWLVRNSVHSSPDWDMIEVITNLRSIMIIYVYTTLKYSTQIESLPNPLENNYDNGQFSGDENKLLYDFISFGNTTTEIKTQILNAFILHYLEKNDNVSIENIKENADKYFEKEFNIRFYERTIEKLRQTGKIEFSDDTKNIITLTKDEKNRLNKILLNFAENKILFFSYLDDILLNYGIDAERAQLIEHFTDFLVANFNIDICEAYDKGIEITDNENEIYHNFIKYLKSIVIGDDIAEKLFRDLLQLCEDSDFLIRVSASRVFSKLTNPEHFQNYIRQQERIVYLDTQIILHAICLNYIPKLKYDNIFYKITDELISLIKDNPNIKLKVSKQYLSEVAYQLKLALLLIPFEEFTKSKYSSNIFYQFYRYLKDNELLNDEDDNFAAFLESWFFLKEEHIYERDFERIAISNITSILKEELNIHIADFPFYEQKDDAVELFNKVIKDGLFSPKSHQVVTNDALMVCHLANPDYHRIEPFFLTWDKSFTKFRKAFKDKFNQIEIISWHLFNPAKFINHISLLDFRIDPKSITNEFLSIIDSFGLHEKTKTIFDSANRLLDIKNIPQEQRRRYIKIAIEIFNQKEFSYEIETPEDTINNMISVPFEIMLDEINKYYYRTDTKYNIEQYRKLMLIEEYFIKVAEKIRDEIKFYLLNHKISEDFLQQIDELIDQIENKEE